MQSKFDELVGNASGSAQPNISFSGIESTSEVFTFNETVDLFFQKWIVNNKENITLSMQRDFLLPQFLSGELSVTQVKQSMESVAC
jgi:type I restriction enzyme S subunit